MLLVEDKDDMLYPPDTLISSHTNKPIATGEKSITKLPVFWCEVCTLKLATPTQAIQHFGGKSHLTTVAPNKTDVDDATTRKRDLDSNSNSVEEEPAMKKKKEDQSVHCKECDIILNSALMAEQHFKGKKHASSLKKLDSAENTSPPVVTPAVSVNKTTFCQFCCVTLNSDGQVKQHYNGVRHKVNAGIIPPERSTRGSSRGRGVRGRGIGLNVGLRGRGRYGGRGRGRGEEHSVNNGSEEAPRWSRGRGELHGRQDWGRGQERRSGQGKGEGYRWTARMPEQELGKDPGKGDVKTHGFGKGNSVVRGRGFRARGWNRGRQNTRGLYNGRIPVGDQYKSGPQVNDYSNTNLQSGREDAMIYSVDSSYSLDNVSTAPPNNPYIKPTAQNAPTSNVDHASMQNSIHTQGSKHYNHNSKDYYGGPYTTTSSEVKYETAPPPPTGKDGSGNYYANGYWADSYFNSQCIYENKPNTKTNYQVNSDAMYDAYYG